MLHPCRDSSSNAMSGGMRMGDESGAGVKGERETDGSYVTANVPRMSSLVYDEGKESARERESSRGNAMSSGVRRVA